MITYETFTVTLRFQFPAWDERYGIEFTVRATSKSDAIRRARAAAMEAGHGGPGKGRAIFTAEQKEIFR